MSLKSLLPVLLGLLCVAPAGAATPPDRTLNASAVWQAPAELDDGGELTIYRMRLQEGGKLYASRNLIARWSLEVGTTRYDFRERADTRWDDIYQVSFSAPLVHPFDRHWSLLVVPGISAAGEADAEVDKSLGYSLVTALNWSPARQLSLGVGGVGYENLGEFQGFPLLMIDWRPAPGWRLSNPLRAGITGPAGLELSREFASGWTVAGGGAWRKLRFRLDDEGSTPGGVGEESLLPVWIRLTRQFDRLQASLYGGVALDGRLTSEDRHGHEVGSEDYADTPFVGLYVSGSL